TELYDCASSVLTNTGELNTPRTGGHTMTLLPNGRVLVAGGADGQNTSSSSVELYDPVIGTWTTAAALGTARLHHSATLMPNGKLLVAGGFNDLTSTTLSSVELYDPAAGKWTTTNSLSTARFFLTTTLLGNGQVLVAGGIGTNALAVSSAELY